MSTPTSRTRGKMITHVDIPFTMYSIQEIPEIAGWYSLHNLTAEHVERINQINASTMRLHITRLAEVEDQYMLSIYREEELIDSIPGDKAGLNKILLATIVAFDPQAWQ